MFLFVYGTLRNGFPGEMEQKLASESEWVGRAVLEHAQLYRVHWENFHFDYPALVQMVKNGPAKDGNFVIGDLVRLKNAEKSIKWLDAYEECGEQFCQPNEYNRKEVAVKLLTENGSIGEKCFLATTYVYGWPIRDNDGHLLAPISQLVHGGDWLTFMQIAAETDHLENALIRAHIRPPNNHKLLTPSQIDLPENPTFDLMRENGANN